MSPKTSIIALLLLGIGYVIGLPLGRMSAWRAVPPSVLSDSSDKSARHQRTARPEPNAAAGADTSLPARLRAILENEKSLGAGSDMTGFDERSAELLRGVSTEALRAAAIELTQSKKKNAAPDDVVRAIFMEWARREPGAAWDVAMKSIPNSKSSTLAASALAGCLIALSTTDYLAALKRADAIPNEVLREEVQKSFQGNAVRFIDPEPLARRLLAMPAGERPKDLLKSTIFTWGQRHLRAALDFTKTLPQAEREEVLPMFCQTLAIFDGAEAERQASTIQDPKRSAEAWRGIYSHYSEFSPEIAADLLERLPVEQMHPSFFDHLNYDFKLSADLSANIAARLTGKSREEFLSEVFRGASIVSDKALQRLLDTIELRPEDGKCITSVVQRLMRSSPDNGLAWAGSLPESPLRDHVMAEASEWVREKDRAHSMVLSASIQDETKRLESLRSNIESWLQNDRSAAVAWLKSANSNMMPPEERDRWLKLSGAK